MSAIELEQEAPITTTLLDDERRINALPRHFGKHLLRLEAMVFDYMRRLSVDYGGGHWLFYELSNGGFYMAPDSQSPMRVTVHGNGYEGTMSADAAGIVACLFAIGQLAAMYEEDRTIEHYHALRHLAAEHGEARDILSAID